MRKWLILISLFALLISPSRAGAQGTVKLDLMNIELWAEYDKPTMLVINQFAVSQDTPLPTSVTLRFPKDANLVAVAVETKDGLFNKNFDPPAEQGDWQAVTVNVESRDPHRIEYYQALTRDGSRREFKYRWFGDYYAKQFAVSILVPADSTALITNPILQNTQTTSDGRGITGTVVKNDMRMGNSFQFEMEYERKSDTLIDTSQADQIQPAQAVGPDTTGRVSIANLPWIIGGFGLALIGIALFSYWRSTQSSESKPRRRHRKVQDEGDGQAYCHECGTRANPGDRFCRICGSRLRME